MIVLPHAYTPREFVVAIVCAVVLGFCAGLLVCIAYAERRERRAHRAEGERFRRAFERGRAARALARHLKYFPEQPLNDVIRELEECPHVFVGTFCILCDSPCPKEAPPVKP